ncbi:uncharacterized protein LOC126385844 isoform X2 [Xyrichtys novacula]|uniref:Uncharacterized protein LOC126385844 isoform X2 n=1 Tax=Xyrichtys novacula TaxID=13765 RepID=A0AAV1F002_XYRNO|nr:uncharacterized protein LOC126385844 isoform X2 [Xyrichtys novacula]
MGGRHLSKIQEETDSREHSTSFLPPLIQQQTGEKGEGGEAVKPGENKAVRQEVSCESERATSAQCEHQEKLENNRTLLEELSRIEAELRESVRLDVERQQEAEFLRQQENNLLRADLCYLSLSQRVARPWVSSYFRNFPMHIYCLPVTATNHKGRRRGLQKWK